MPSAMSWRMAVAAAGCGRRCGAGRCGDAAPRPSATSTACADERPGRRRPRTGRHPSGGPASWLSVMKPVCIRALADGQVVAARPASAAASASCCRRTPRPCRARTATTSTTAIDTRPVTIGSVSTASTQRAHRSTRDDDQPPVEPVRQRPGVQPEQQRRQPLQRRRQGDQERVVRQRRHQQRPGRERDAVAEVADPRRRQQPAEPDPEPGRRDDVDEPAHKSDRLEVRP